MIQSPCRRATSPSRLSVVLIGLLIVLGLAACGHKEAHPTVADNEGFYVDAGPITYEVQISRELNPYSTEDRNYLTGVTATAPKPDEEWFAIFMWAKNQTKHPATTTDSFDIVDTQGNTYHPVIINAQANPFAWTAEKLQPGAVEPGPDTVASFGPTQGGELLFKLNQSAYANRPLTLEIYAQGQANPSTVSLDL
ncbi:MAG: hypothetical protein ACYC91_01615 [Solirubrobacteraceae bacterium]